MSALSARVARLADRLKERMGEPVAVRVIVLGDDAWLSTVPLPTPDGRLATHYGTEDHL